MMTKKIFILAGEASGDLHGANLIRALRGQNPLAEIYGVGGDKMKAAGALEFFDLAHFHVTGISQALLKLPQYLNAEKIVLEKIRRVRPDAVIVIDNPGFNLHLAPKLRPLTPKLFYYIAPQLWAWKKNRIYKIKKYFDRVLVVFDFEKKLYEEHGVPVSFVGHPLKDILPQARFDKSSGEPLVTLMPGSRRHEVSTLLPIFLNTARLLNAQRPSLRLSLIESPTLPAAFYDEFFKGWDLSIERVRTDAYKTIAESHLVIACSGTATLECALLGTPMIICNKAGLLTYAVARIVVKIPYLGLPNIILNRPAFPELLQYDATPEKIARHARQILGTASGQQRIKADLREITEKLGPGGASGQAAREILSFIQVMKQGSMNP